MSKVRILVVDDEEHFRFSVKRALVKKGYEIYEATDGEQALKQIKKINFDLALVDIRMPRMDGFILMKHIKQIRPYLTVIVITAYGSSRVVHKAIEMGAYDYFNKPVDLNEIRIVVDRALEKRRLEQEIVNLRAQMEYTFDYTEIIGRSASMQKVFKMLDKIVDKDVTVMITGASGTGKELVARAIHKNSHRRDKPFIRINCVAIPETLLESELFGFEKGAFTGAEKQTIGKFEMAQGGTLFLDEIGDMPLKTQAKLLRVLQEREIERIGGKESIHVDIRVLAATNQDLEHKVEEGTFRKDLFFRLNVIHLEVPSLVERREDIPLLAEYFIKLYRHKLGHHVEGISPEAIEILKHYHWPGNIRELENIIQRGVVLSTGKLITADVLPSYIKEKRMSSGSDSVLEYDLEQPFHDQMNQVIEYYEKKYLQKILEQMSGTKEEIARKIGISRKNLYNKLSKYGMM